MTSCKVCFPYGTDKIQAEIPERNLLGIVEANDIRALKRPDETTMNAIVNPLKSDSLLDIARSRSKVVIMTSDAMRPGNYRRLILPEVLEQLKGAGVREADITILDANGSHQNNTRRQWTELYGQEVVARYRVMNNSFRDKRSMVDLGKSELGDSVIVNKLMIESDLCIGIGSIQPATPTCGYSGGIKLYAIGAASMRTIFDTHRARIYWHPTSRCGVTVGNEFRRHINAVGERIFEKSKAEFFTINAVTNSETEIIGIFAGDAAKVYEKGCALADKQWKVPIKKAADVVVAAVDHPQASNPYELNVSMSMLTRYPTEILRPGGVLIFVGICDSSPSEGSPSSEFLKLMREFHEVNDIISEVRRHEEHEELEQPTLSNFLLHTRAYGTALMVSNYSLVLVVGSRFPGFIRDMHFTSVRTIERALEIAKSVCGDAEMLVVPKARASVPYVR